jgi:hypothetical protein
MKKILFLFVFICSTNIVNAQWQQTSLDTGLIYCFALNGNNIFTGGYNGVYLSTNNGNNWNAVNTGLTSTWVAALSIKDDTIFAGMWGGFVYMSSNNGNSWTAIGMPAGIRSLTTKGNEIFAGTEYDGVYLSSNSGLSWAPVNNGIPLYLGMYSTFFTFAISDSNIFAGSSSGVFLSTNNGSNWTAVNTGLIVNWGVHALAVSGNNIFAGTKQNGVFLSSNNGSNWTAVNTGLTNTNINALAIKGNNIFAGTEGGVFLSSDNGNSWTSINTGLVDTVVLSLAINGNTIFAGTSGGGVWKRPLSEVGLNEINNNAEKIIVYPNPASINLTIEASQKSTIEILSIQGQTILQQQVQQGKNDIDISGLANGIYFLKWANSNMTGFNKFIKE